MNGKYTKSMAIHKSIHDIYYSNLDSFPNWLLRDSFHEHVLLQ